MRELKSAAEVQQILEDVQRNIEYYQSQANSFKIGTDEFEHYDRQYAKATAQYNILLKVFK